MIFFNLLKIRDLMTIKLEMSNKNFMFLGFGIQKLYEKIISFQLWWRIGSVFFAMIPRHLSRWTWHKVHRGQKCCRHQSLHWIEISSVKIHFAWSSQFLLVINLLSINEKDGVAFSPRTITIKKIVFFWVSDPKHRMSKAKQTRSTETLRCQRDKLQFSVNFVGCCLWWQQISLKTSWCYYWRQDFLWHV